MRQKRYFAQCKAQEKPAANPPFIHQTRHICVACKSTSICTNCWDNWHTNAPPTNSEPEESNVNNTDSKSSSDESEDDSDGQGIEESDVVHSIAEGIDTGTYCAL